MDGSTRVKLTLIRNVKRLVAPVEEKCKRVAAICHAMHNMIKVFRARQQLDKPIW